MNLGNAWHFPGNGEFPANAEGMRSPVFPTDVTKTITIYSGNQSAGGGNAGNQNEIGSAVVYKRPNENWTEVAMKFYTELGNNKYFKADIPVQGLAVGSQVQYYLSIAYSDHRTTYLRAQLNERSGIMSEAVGSPDEARASPFVLTIDSRKTRGQWSEPFLLTNVGAHAHLLRTGKVLFWGRRDDPAQSMSVSPPDPPDPTKGPNPAPPATCTPFLVDVSSDPPTCEVTPQPSLNDGEGNANLFCSGHTFQPDGTLLVIGGHIKDTAGLDQSCTYDPGEGKGVGTWKAGPRMGKEDDQGKRAPHGRWYPTVTALPSGTTLVASGSYWSDNDKKGINNVDVQVKIPSRFLSTSPATAGIFDLYPRMHVASTGIVYAISSGGVNSLDFAKPEQGWNQIDGTKRQTNDYCSTVMYAKDQVIMVGGSTPPTKNAAVINLSFDPDKDKDKIKWKRTADMAFDRRQHNATVLPDGSVFVTGGTRGNGDFATENITDVKFNDLQPGQPVHIAELWKPGNPNPEEGKWTMMAAEQTDRCYHSTAVLLPDGRVLSAGGGEFQLGSAANPAKDSHRDAQIFSPPYLFQGGLRPEIKSISKVEIELGGTLDIGTQAPDRPVICDSLDQHWPAP
jgi:hypothetical protein